jgi:hypothetical protein
MASLTDRRWIFAGGALALAAGFLAAVVMGGLSHNSPQAPPASQGALSVQTGRDDDIKLDPKRPLRCFVGGQLIGELPLAECARRNGVAAGALDVGLDPSGALAGANGETTQITPLDPAQSPAADLPPARVAQAQSAPVGPADLAGPEPASCWRYAGARWNVLSRPMSLGACVQSLYDGQCEHPGAAAYGRWGARTLRLVAGRIEVSSDNRNFAPLVEQGPGCSVPAS